MTNKGLGRRRGLRLALAVLVLAALTYGLDRLARKGPQALVASAIRTDRQLSAGPDVTIEGAFFLPQVVRGSVRTCGFLANRSRSARTPGCAQYPDTSRCRPPTWTPA